MKIKLDPIDKLFSQVIKLRVEGKCEYCGGIGNQTSHFHGRRRRSVRWDLDNAIWTCFSCHMYLGEHPNKHYEFFRKRLGTERFEALNIRAEKLIKPDREFIKEDLKKIIHLFDTSEEGK